MSTLEKPTTPQIENGQIPVEQTGIFLVDSDLAEPKVHSRVTLFNPSGELIYPAIQDIQKIVAALGKLGGEVIQNYHGYVPHRAEVPVKDNRGRATGETKWIDVQKPGPDGVECVIYIRQPA